MRDFIRLVSITIEFVHLVEQNTFVMMKYLRLFLVFQLLITLNTSINAQYVVRKVTDKSVNTAQDGFYYNLPLTVLKVNVVYEKIEKIRGPLSDFTLNYLGTSDYIADNSSSYRILNIDITPESNIDPNQIYYVQFPAERDKDEKEMVFSLSSLGTLLGFDESGISHSVSEKQEVDQTYILLDGDKDFDFRAEYNRKKQFDTITRRITIDTVSIDRFIFKTSWVDKSDEDKANEAAMQIEKIRESRFNLLTGYQEVNYGESMKYMDTQLKKLENQYLELFLGKELKSIESQTIYYTPEIGESDETLLEFSDGNTVSINILSQQSVANLPENPLEKVDNIFYRIPNFAIIEVEHNGTIHYRRMFTINQLGVTATAPLNRTRSQFDFKTGGLKQIVRE